ncbi:MAG: SMP-30/gluconolactonase/LRE family protein [Prevotellaceae bacterium]|jgi:sugar lactone lactonase YvrE|nr:SMP-30/gluconolactonase/LRE family protein [Prevotellaceae bacterium]
MRLKHFTFILLAVCCACSEPALKKTTLLGGQPLPECCASPDGCTLGNDGYIYVSVNQVASGWKYPAKIVRISPDDAIEDFFTLPVNGKTGKASPLGITFAADGNLYISDNQSFCTDEPNQAGVIRVIMENGKPQRGELAVTGFNASNGIASRGNCLYVVETDLGATDRYMSGVYRFSLDELTSGDTLRVTGIGDPHLILAFETKSKEQRVGANGAGFDSKGNLYVNNFGDAEIMKYTFDADGKTVSGEVFCRPEGALSLDGMQVDSEDNLWIADFAGNAIIKVETNTGKSSIIAKNKIPSDGVNGELDTPSECIRRGNKVYVSNIDLNSGVHTADTLQTISVIYLTK